MENQNKLSYLSATGKIDYNMTNNYMFRYILQKNQKVLKGLICSLLHLKPETVKNIVIKNPINLSENVTGKEFILDIKVMLNDETLINLEMQVANEYNWPERSLAYLCRAYDQLYRGQKYEEALPVIHIGFLDFTLHPSEPEFYATYQMLNIKNHLLYSSKFTLSVVNLNQIKLATEEDREYQIDYWAAMFKAGTWEEIKMLTKENEYLQEAAESLYVANADEIVRQQCIAREDAERRERTLERIAEQHRIAREDAERRERTLERLVQEHETARVNAERKGHELEQLVQEHQTAREDAERQNRTLENQLTEKDKEIEKLKAMLAEKGR